MTKPTRLDINDLALKNRIVMSTLLEYDRGNLTYEEALIGMVKLLSHSCDAYRLAYNSLVPYAPVRFLSEMTKPEDT